MSNEEYQILGYEETDRWYAIVLRTNGQTPVYVYYVPCDNPMPPKEEKQ